MYARGAGKLMAFLMLSSLVMAMLTYWSSTAALVQMVICLVIFGLLWKKMNEKYGA